MITIEDVNKLNKHGEKELLQYQRLILQEEIMLHWLHNVETLYAYDIGKVLFKPTLAAQEQFRPTFETALSYFVASEWCMFRRPRFCN